MRTGMDDLAERDADDTASPIARQLGALRSHQRRAIEFLLEGANDAAVVTPALQANPQPTLTKALKRAAVPQQNRWRCSTASRSGTKDCSAR
jgi:tryptophan 2,3-dioxygenase